MEMNIETKDTLITPEIGKSELCFVSTPTWTPNSEFDGDRKFTLSLIHLQEQIMRKENKK